MTIDDVVLQVEAPLDNLVKTYVHLAGLSIDLAADIGLDQIAMYSFSKRIQEANQRINTAVVMLSEVLTAMKDM